MTSYTFTPIGFIRSCFSEKFGIPRQPGLVSEATGQLHIEPPYRRYEAFRCLEKFSHIWILFVFHQTHRKNWKPTVRPPRLGGNQRVGVFASRSGFRPNPIGQSVVELDAIEKSDGKMILHLKGIDLLDGTPVIDIKPYLPYADSLPSARVGYAPAPARSNLSITFSKNASSVCERLEGPNYPQLKRLIENLLALDPRPGYADGNKKVSYGMQLWDLNIRFNVIHQHITVEKITDCQQSNTADNTPYV